MNAHLLLYVFLLKQVYFREKEGGGERSEEKGEREERKERSNGPMISLPKCLYGPGLTGWIPETPIWVSRVNGRGIIA